MTELDMMYFALVCALTWAITMTSKHREVKAERDELQTQRDLLQASFQELNTRHTEMMESAEQAHQNSIDARKLFLASVQGLNAVGFELYQREDGNIVITHVGSGEQRAVAPMGVH